MQNTRDAGEWAGDWDNHRPRAYCDDEVREKNRFIVRGREEMKEEEVYGVCQRMVESAESI